MSEFKRGQHVKVSLEFEGTVNHVNGNGTLDVSRGESGDHFPVEYIPQESITALVENWPPQLGDIWSVDGDEYFARQSTAYTDVVVLESFSRINTMRYYSSEFERFKARGPVLVRRK